jgi:dienelactone hydrolase
VVDQPIRIFHGTADDYVPVGPCRAYAERLRKAGKDVRLAEYPGARHVFDWALLKTPLPMPKAQTVRRCTIEEAAEGRLVNAQTRQPFTFKGPCVERGVTIGYDAQAAAEARAAVKELVTAVLQRP